MGFADDIARFALKVQNNSDALVRQVVIDIMQSIMEMSPVGDPSRWVGWEKGGVAANQGHWLVKAGFVGEGYVGGHFRANWHLNIGAIPSGIIDGTDKEGKATLDKAKAVIPQKAAGLVYYFGNNLPYAIPLEEGHSGQAPHGMVGVTAVRFGDFIEKEAAKLP